MSQVTLDGLNRTDAAGFTEALGDIFEHSAWVAAAVVDRRPFASLQALLDAMTAAVNAAPAERQMELIRAHPDLAGKAARAGTLTVASSAEQSGVGLDRLSEAGYAEFHRLNEAYRAKFGMPFIICVRRHTRESILRSFAQRLAHGPDAERAAALAEIYRIAALRIGATVGAAVPLRLSGRISTHVLDTVLGRPAAGVVVSLWDVTESQAHQINEATTNADGRTDAPLLTGRPIPVGVYELRFSVGEYFKAQSTAAAEPPFLDVVPLRFSVAEPEGDYHVPLLMTPWSYSTYRGS